MDLSALEEVKEKLIHATEFSEVFDLITERFGAQPEFLELGEPTRNKVLEETVTQIVSKILGKKSTLAAIIVMRLPDQPFLFGEFHVGRAHGNFIYFEDVRSGLLRATGRAVPGTMYSRFSAMPFNDPAKAQSN